LAAIIWQFFGFKKLHLDARIALSKSTAQLPHTPIFQNFNRA